MGRRTYGDLAPTGGGAAIEQVYIDPSLALREAEGDNPIKYFEETEMSINIIPVNVSGAGQYWHSWEDLPSDKKAPLAFLFDETSSVLVGEVLKALQRLNEQDRKISRAS